MRARSTNPCNRVLTSIASKMTTTPPKQTPYEDDRRRRGRPVGGVKVSDEAVLEALRDVLIRGVSRAEVARKLNIPPATLGQWLDGTNRPRLLAQVEREVSRA